MISVTGDIITIVVAGGDPMRNASTCARRLISVNCKFATQIWGNEVGQIQLRSLREMTERFRLSLCAGDLRLLQGSWYVTHAGLLRVASKHHCAGIQVEAIHHFCDPSLPGC